MCKRAYANNGGNGNDSGSLIPELGRDLSMNCLLRCSRSDYPAIALVNRDFRSLIRSGEIFKLRRMAGIKEHWVYFSCNLLAWEAFDPIRCKWMKLPELKANSCFMFSDKESLAVGANILLFGKEIDSSAVYKYSLLSNEWSLCEKTKVSRCLFASASFGEFGIVAGGCDTKGNVLRSVEIYNSETNTWESLPSMNKPRKLCSGAIMDGKFYAIGGIGEDSGRELVSAQVFDLKTKTWEEIPNMLPQPNGSELDRVPAGCKSPPLLAVVKNELYGAFHAQNELRKYDKERNVWIPLGKLPEQACSINGWGIAFRACGDLLLVIGGPRSSCGGFVEINGWEPNDGPPQWVVLGRKHCGNFVYNCTVMGC